MVSNEWESCLLGDVITLQRGFDLPNRLRFSGDVPIVSSAGVMDYHNETPLSGPGVVTGRYGTIGEVFFVEEDYWPLNTTLFVSDFKGNDPLFVSYLLKTVDFKSHSGKSGVPGINRNDIHEIPVKCPPQKEQKIVAKALLDGDSTITSLEKLIAKKRAIKTATMQQLLTGKKRLPGFDYVMDTVAFGDLFEETISRKSIDTTSEVSFIGMQDVSDRATVLNNRLCLYSEVKSGFTYFERNDILVAKITPCFENGKGAILNELLTEQGFGSTEFHVLRARKGCDPRYIYQHTLLESFRRELEAEMVGSAGHRRVPFSAIRNYPLLSKHNYDEQVAISDVLTAMDSEVEQLSLRLKKTEKLKQGMMQELLTGRTRLI